MTDPVDLFGPAAADLALVERQLRDEIQDDPPEVGQPMADLFSAGGKRIRPALVLLAAMCGRYDPERAIPAAKAVEVTHAATLVHDDVIDRSPTRRGHPTVAASRGDEPAIVIGDFYFAKAYEYAANTRSPEVVVILAEAVMRICVGEVRQQEIRYRYSTGVEEYMRRIEAKTAALLAACCDIGGLLGGLDEQKRSALREYGRSLGLAFQIADDVLDYVGSEGEVGKPIGHDVHEGFATLPLMLAAVTLQDDHKLSDREARSVVEAVRNSDGPRRAREEARRHAEIAAENLHAFESTDVTRTLASLADYVVSRKL